MKNAFEAALERIAEKSLNGVPAKLRESIRYSLLGGGKRIRPRLVEAVGTAMKLPIETSYRLGSALEMVHAYTLVHDDLPAMDDDDLRRGVPTNHRVYGEAVAILAGDSLALLAIDTLIPLSVSLGAERTFAIARILLEAGGARGVIAGQAAEFDLENRSESDLEDLFEVFRLKTGALFRAALAMPLLAGGVEESGALYERASRLGETLGIAFQIADDLEDDFGAEKANRAHIAAYLSAGEARLKGEEMLSGALASVKDISPAVATALIPFVNELMEKLSAPNA